MATTMQYREYVASVEFDADSRSFHGVVANIVDTVTFVGSSVRELEREFRRSIDEYVRYCAELGQEPDRPFSGKFLLRLEPRVHRAVAIAAANEKKSINAWIAQTIQSAVADS